MLKLPEIRSRLQRGRTCCLKFRPKPARAMWTQTIPIVFGMFDAVMLGNREATSMDQIPPVIGSKDCAKPAYGDVGTLIMGPEDTRGQSCSRLTRCTMTLIAFAGCLYRKLNSTIMLVEATHDRLRCDATFVLDSTMDWSVLAKRSMSPQLVVVGSILRQDPA
jgi:hypothetical protein